MVTPGTPPIPHVGGPIIKGEPMVLIGFMPAARVGDMATCVGPPDTIAMGSTGVTIGFLPAARMGDLTVHGGSIVVGCPTVMIGEMGAGGAPAQGASMSAATRSRSTLPIDDPAVKAAMRQAWEDSQANDPKNRHEEGGYIVKNPDGSYGVARWPRGAGASIAPPPRDSNGKYKGKEVVGEFHTHPNPPVDENGKKWTQGGHRGDWDGIKAEKYPGDSYIISGGHVWKVSPDGKPTVDKSGNEVPYGSREDVLGK